MIHVTARITLKAGTSTVFLRVFRELAVLVRQEPGCLDYFPARDVDMKLESQQVHEDAVTIVEKWASLAALRRHLRSGHMRGFQEHVRDLIVDVDLSIVEEV